MIIAYRIDWKMEITALYLSQTSLNFESGFTASTNLSSASLNRLIKEYASPLCSNSLSAPCRQPACKHSSNSSLDIDACLENGYCRLFSPCFNIQLEYNSEMGTLDISHSRCFSISGDLTAVTRQFISTQLSTVFTVKDSKSLQASYTPWILRTRVSTSMNCTFSSSQTGTSAKHECIFIMGATLGKNWRLARGTYSPGKHPYSPLVLSTYFLVRALAAQRTSNSPKHS